MVKKYLYLLALPLVVASACQSGPSEAEQKAQLEAKVLALHDEAMAEMGTIYRLRRNLTGLRDSLQTHAPDTTITKQLTREIALLNAADEAMMSWMRQYKAPAENQAPQEALHYLQQQQTKMEQVKNLMDSTITVAQTIVKKHEKH